MLVQRGTTTIADGNTSTTVTLPNPVPVGKSFAIVNGRIGSAESSTSIFCMHTLSTVVNGKYTELVITRSNDNGTVTASWQVVNGPMLTVQRGQTTLSSGTGTASITAVDRSRAFIIISNTAVTTTGEECLVKAQFNSTTEIQFDLDSGASAAPVVEWQVIEWEGASVQEVSSGAMNNTTLNVAISEVDLNKTFVVYSWTTNEANPLEEFGEDVPKVELSSTTNIAVSRGGDTTQLNLQFFVVSIPDGSVQSGDFSISGTSNTDTISTAVNTDFTFMPMPFLGNGYYDSGASVTSDKATHTQVLTDGTTITGTRATTDTNAMNLAWFTVEFDPQNESGTAELLEVTPELFEENSVEVSGEGTNALHEVEPTIFDQQVRSENKRWMDEETPTKTWTDQEI